MTPCFEHQVITMAKGAFALLQLECLVVGSPADSNSCPCQHAIRLLQHILHAAAFENHSETAVGPRNRTFQLHSLAQTDFAL